MYVFLTILLGVMIAGYGAAFAFGCRLPPREERREGRAVGPGS